MQCFVKYCKKEHNIQLGCKTIKVGNLEFYRGEDPAFTINEHIVDYKEGKERIVVSDYDSEKATPEAKMLLNFGDGKVVLLGSMVEFHFVNSLIFCVSFDSGKDYIEHAQKLGYDSKYLIRDINKFALKLAALIMENFKTNWFANSISSQLEEFTIVDYKQINLGLHHKPVKYVNEKDLSIVGSEVKGNILDAEYIDRAVFTKEEKYKDEKEYRLLFTFEHPRLGVMPVRKEPIVFPISPLANELLPVT